MKKGLIALGLVGAAAYFILKGGGGPGLTVGGDSPPGTVLGGISQPSQTGSSSSAPNMVYNISFPEFGGFPDSKKSSGQTTVEPTKTLTSAAWVYGTPDQPKPMQDPLSVASRGVTGNAIATFLSGGPSTDLSATAVSPPVSAPSTKKEISTSTFGGGGAGGRIDNSTRKFNPTTVYGTTAPAKMTLGGGGIYEAFSGSSKLNIETKKMSSSSTVSGSRAKGTGYSRYGLSTSSY